jgi:hypothetical protein
MDWFRVIVAEDGRELATYDIRAHDERDAEDMALVNVTTGDDDGIEYQGGSLTFQVQRTADG